jgi:serine/threonine-protein kinase HipA
VPESFNPVERLCYHGRRAMGALEFKPALLTAGPSESPHLDALVSLAGEALASRNDLHVNPEKSPAALATILRVGTSAGGARAKAVIC